MLNSDSSKPESVFGVTRDLVVITCEAGMFLSDGETAKLAVCTSDGTFKRVNQDGSRTPLEDCSPLEGCL